jgi:leucine-rich repeat protein SHOC2
MKAFLTILIVLSTCQLSTAQITELSELEGLRQFTSMEEALAQPDSVYRLRVKAKGGVIPTEVFNSFPNLLELDISRNRLKVIPTEIGQLKKLRRLLADRNKIATLPKEIGDLIALEELVMNRNELTELPKEIGNLTNLRRIDLWSNNLQELPYSMRQITGLKEVDLRVIVMSDDQKDDIRELLPDAKVHLDKGCNCGR